MQTTTPTQPTSTTSETAVYYDASTDTLRYSNGAAAPTDEDVQAELERRGLVRPANDRIPRPHSFVADIARVRAELTAAALAS